MALQGHAARRLQLALGSWPSALQRFERRLLISQVHRMLVVTAQKGLGDTLPPVFVTLPVGRGDVIYAASKCPGRGVLAGAYTCVANSPTRMQACPSVQGAPCAPPGAASSRLAARDCLTDPELRVHSGVPRVSSPSSLLGSSHSRLTWSPAGGQLGQTPFGALVTDEHDRPCGHHFICAG